MNDEAQTGSLLPKACEACRTRKIRCNKVFPCSNCETSGISCRPATKQLEQRPRVVVSVNYERQIEQINERLVGIEEALSRLHVETHASASTSPFVIANAAPGASISSDVASSTQVKSTPATFEGASSFTDQAFQASQAAGLTFAQDVSGSAEVADALLSLRDLHKTFGASTVSHDFRFGGPIAAPTGIKLLPLEVVLSLLRTFKGKPLAYLLSFAVRDPMHLEKLCQKVYFSLEPVSLGALTCMNAGLYFLMAQLKYLYPSGEEYIESVGCRNLDIDALRKQCLVNFQLGIETYEVVSVPSLDNVSALVMGMLRAQEECKPLLAWNLTSAAARQVLNLGYHRKNTLKNDPFDVAEEKRQVFWTVYTFDKNLALNLGYTPNFQDWDIDVEMFTVSSDTGAIPWERSVIAVADLARLQGLMYERLYSLSGLSAPLAERLRSIDDLSAQFTRWYNEWTSIDASQAYLPEVYFLTYGPFDVVYYSLLTSVHRASTTTSAVTEITSICYEAAKKSLRSHLHFSPIFFGDDQSPDMLCCYVSWVLLYASWTPLIVVFLHALASSSLEDVQLLKDTHMSLEPVKELNQHCSRVYGICKIFCKFATVFVESKSTFPGTYDPRGDIVVMPQLQKQHVSKQSQNGLPITTAGASMQQNSTSLFDTNQMNDMSMFLGDWLGGNQPVMNLWNVDFLNDFDMSQDAPGPNMT